MILVFFSAEGICTSVCVQLLGLEGLSLDRLAPTVQEI